MQFLRRTSAEVYWSRLDFSLNVWFAFDSGTQNTFSRAHYVEASLGDKASAHYGELNRQYVTRNVDRGMAYVIDGIEVDPGVVLNQQRSRVPPTDSQANSSSHPSISSLPECR